MKKIYIQPRDTQLLNFLNRYHLMTTGQISKLVFSGVNKATILRRLRLLEKHNYICQSAILDNYSRTWQLDEKAALVVPDVHIFKTKNRATICHDILLTEIRLRLESLGLGHDWISDFEIKSLLSENMSLYDRPTYPINPDGVMIESINSNHKSIAIELELTQKSRSRYKDICLGYFSQPKINYVLYIIKDKNLFQSLTNLNRDYGHLMEKILICYVDDLLTKEDFKIYFIKDRKWKFLNELGFDLYVYKNQKPAHGIDLGVSDF